jgi:hypothetical protein
MTNIDTKMTMIYDFIYSKTFKGNIKEFDINIENINIDDIKFTHKDDDENYLNILTELFTGKFKKIDYIEDLTMLILKRYSDSLSSSIYISPYIKKEDILDINSSNNNDALFSYILSKLVLSKKTKHISLPILNIDVKFSQMADIIKPYDTIYENYMALIEKDQITDIFSIKMKENFFKSFTMIEFIEMGNFNMKKLLFQIIHTLAILQEEYAGFRHNMLNPSNIYIYMKKQTDSLDKYIFDNLTFYIPENNFEIKITNFGMANIPKSYGVSKDNSINNYCDLHCLMNDLIKIIDLSTLDSETKDFIDHIIPKKYRNMKKSTKLTSLHKPSELLKHDYFVEFTKKISVKNTEMMSSDGYYTNKISKGTRRLSGGATFFAPPDGNKIHNDPNITNENRRIYNMEKQPKEEKTPKDRRIMEQKINENPYYNKPYKVKPAPSWDPSHVPMPAKTEVPQAQYHIPTEKNNQQDTIEDSSMNDLLNNTFSEMDANNTSDEQPKRKYDKSKYDKSKYDKPNRKNMYDNKQDNRYDNKQDNRYDNKQDNRYDNKQDNRYDNKQDNRYDNKQDNRRNTNSPTNKQYSNPPPNYQTNITELPLLAEQKLYQPPASSFPAGTMHTHPKYNNPAWVSIDNQVTYPPAFVPDSSSYFPFGIPLQKPNELPLQKIYNINLGDPTVHNSLLNTIYEDKLPGDPHIFTMSSVHEREQLIAILRNSMIRMNDGEEMSLQAGDKSMMEHIKLLHFNPYALGKNPYSMLPVNFLLYSGAYPIRYNSETHRIEIAKQPISVNIRIYMMSYASFNYQKLTLDRHNFDVWRDLDYYQYIRTEILQKKISPNFVSFILYKFDTNSKINYKTLQELIRTHKSADDVIRAITNNRDVNALIARNTELKDLMIRGKNRQYKSLAQIVDKDEDCGASMIILTESPTHNFIGWASPIYEISGARQIQTSVGYHSPEAWRSVLFQLVYAMAVLQEKNIYIRNFSIANNVFIKDIFNDMNNIGHWKYTIDNVDMYVPNYGHILLIDNRFVDNTIPNTYKIHGEIYKSTSFRTEILDDFKRIFNPEDFTNNFQKDYGLLAPDASIIDLITNLHNKAHGNIKDIIIELFPEYVHNRVGSLLTKSEKDVLMLTTMPKLIKGRMVVYMSRYDEYKWAIYHGDNGNKKQIILKEQNNVIGKDVFAHSLFDHPDAYTLPQISEKNYKLTKESLIDSYLC